MAPYPAFGGPCTTGAYKTKQRLNRSTENHKTQGFPREVYSRAYLCIPHSMIISTPYNLSWSGNGLSVLSSKGLHPAPWGTPSLRPRMQSRNRSSPRNSYRPGMHMSRHGGISGHGSYTRTSLGLLGPIMYSLDRIPCPSLVWTYYPKRRQ